MCNVDYCKFKCEQQYEGDFENFENKLKVHYFAMHIKYAWYAFKVLKSNYDTGKNKEDI